MGFFDRFMGKKRQQENEEYKVFLDTCYQELAEKQTALTSQYELRKYDGFLYDQETEILQFKVGEAVGLEFEVIPIGSWSSKSNTWMWAWANESVIDRQREKSARIRELADITGAGIFVDEAFEAEEVTAHELTSMAVHHLEALGMYIAPSENLKTFLALMRVQGTVSDLPKTLDDIFDEIV